MGDYLLDRADCQHSLLNCENVLQSTTHPVSMPGRPATTLADSLHAAHWMIRQLELLEDLTTLKIRFGVLCREYTKAL